MSFKTFILGLWQTGSSFCIYVCQSKINHSSVAMNSQYIKIFRILSYSNLFTKRHPITYMYSNHTILHFTFYYQILYICITLRAPGTQKVNTDFTDSKTETSSFRLTKTTFLKLAIHYHCHIPILNGALLVFMPPCLAAFPGTFRIFHHMKKNIGSTTVFYRFRYIIDLHFSFSHTFQNNF
jgi:hypothetical protein